MAKNLFATATFQIGRLGPKGEECVHLLELMFAFSPDSGSGAAEGLLLGTISLALLAWRWRRSARMGSGKY